MRKESMEKKKYCDAMDCIEAPGKLVEQVKAIPMTSEKKWSIRRRLVYAAMAAVVLLVAGTVGSYEAAENAWFDKVKRTVFFYSTKKEAEEARKADGIYRNYGISSVLTEGDADDWDQETYDPGEVYFALGEEENLVTDERGTSEDVWTRKMVKTMVFTGNIDITAESYAGEDASGLLTLHPFLKKWDISWLDEHYKPSDKGHYLQMIKRTDTEDLLYSALEAAYADENGGDFFLWSVYEVDGNFVNDHINEEDLDDCEYYQTVDGVEFAIIQKGNMVMGILNRDTYNCIIEAKCMTVEQVEEIADHLKLAELIGGFSTEMSDK